MTHGKYEAEFSLPSRRFSVRPTRDEIEDVRTRAYESLARRGVRPWTASCAGRQGISNDIIDDSADATVDNKHKGTQPGRARSAARKRPASAPIVGIRGEKKPGPAAPVLETVSRGCSSQNVKDRRAQLVEDSAASSTKQLLERALRDTRADPRPWFDRHHLTSGNANISLRPEHREYFDAPRIADINLFATEFLDLKPDKSSPSKGSRCVTDHIPVGRVRPQSVGSVSRLADGFWQAPEEEVIANAVRRAGEIAKAHAEIADTSSVASVDAESVPRADDPGWVDSKLNTKCSSRESVELQLEKHFERCWARQRDQRWRASQRRRPDDRRRSGSHKADRTRDARLRSTYGHPAQFVDSMASVGSDRRAAEI